ncbi:MAG: type II secretion system protein, partial [Gammaproteobacteria bacterium]|nr:type II secretion system protein [Gammaproteobacteria bacterium]
MKSQAHISGFTLLEMLLVMAIIAGIMLGIATYSQQRILQLREDRAVLQIQQILNAGLAYYLNNTQWPDSISTNLQGTATSAGYLPGPSSAVTISNPWGTSYIIGNTTMKTLSSTGIFAVCTTVNAGAATSTIA